MKIGGVVLCVIKGSGSLKLAAAHPTLEKDPPPPPPGPSRAPRAGGAGPSSALHRPAEKVWTWPESLSTPCRTTAQFPGAACEALLTCARGSCSLASGHVAPLLYSSHATWCPCPLPVLAMSSACRAPLPPMLSWWTSAHPWSPLFYRTDVGVSRVPP